MMLKLITVANPAPIEMQPPNKNSKNINILLVFVLKAAN